MQEAYVADTEYHSNAALIEASEVDLQYPRPGDLQKVLRSTIHPVIGGKYLVEYLSERKFPCIEPKYGCKLCNVTTNLDRMISHVFGMKHQNKVLFKTYGMKSNANRDIFMQNIRRYERENGPEIQLIEVIRDNNAYPWWEPKTRTRQKHLAKPKEDTPPHSHLMWNMGRQSFNTPHPTPTSSGQNPSSQFNLPNTPEVPEDFSSLQSAQGPQQHFLSMLSLCFVLNDEDARFALNVAQALSKSYVAYKMPKLKGLPIPQLQSQLESIKFLMDFPKCISGLSEMVNTPGGKSNDSVQTKELGDNGDVQPPKKKVVKGWWNDELAALHKKKYRMARRYHRNPCEANFKLLKIARGDFRKAKRQSQCEYAEKHPELSGTIEKEKEEEVKGAESEEEMEGCEQMESDNQEV